MDALARRLRTAVLAIDGVVESAGIFDEGDAFFMDSKQIGRIDGHALEVRLTRALISERRAALKRDARVDVRRSGSDWIVVTVEGPADIRFATALAKAAADAHRPPPGVPMRPPPVGADLERRRRFH
jgi:hypothetical protein